MKQTALPISIKEFADALFKKPCQIPYRHGQKGHKTLGLAVSGGVDSMALAALCIQMKKNYIPFASDEYPINLNKIDFRAIIVNHGVRDGSLEEARKVTGVLESLGMPSRILSLPWKDVTGNPSSLPNFESLARKYRFQAIGEYCRKLDISSVLLGHHADDQVETILMRLTKGALGVGLLGIKPSSPIPECEGMYGVHESGSPITLSMPISDMMDYQWPPRTRDIGQVNSDLPASGTSRNMTQLELESGGVTVYRPLLPFPKERLIATCKALGVEWFEDNTNTDPTLTDRNAIRHLYDRRGMPWVLPKSKVLSLAAQVQETHDIRQQKVDQFMKKCEVLSFDTRRGTLLIRFPFLPHDIIDRKTLAAMILRRIIMIVTPNAVVSLDRVFSAVSEIFPLPGIPVMSKFLNTAGVMFQRLNSDQESLSNNEWHIHRQRRYRVSSDEVVVPELLPAKLPKKFLFDNRYWLLIHNELKAQAGTLVVRLFQTSDMNKLERALGGQRLRILKKLLRTIRGEEGWRYSLPVVVWKPHGGFVVVKEVIVGLPTLGVKVSDFSHVEWRCWYKKINLDDLGLQAAVDSAAVEPYSLEVRRVMKLKGEISDKPGFAPWLRKRESSTSGDAL
ncbi:hypothetical protein SBOR_4906 [Sclerotinia borealis F-4128]|uniref:tRNA(Ile)-lysidine synthetase n=1 Tax=Sclerotinia borealis (strain F-4128) TaxID=1432307 RepID=W9CD61_SCLBF|nr:hypothetical protein SBOR_4906 [Sclerotinia borealis F-4128]